MPFTSSSQIVGGGANLLAPVTVNRIPMVVDVGPPGALSDSELRQWLDGAVNVITVGLTDVRGGIGATETFRLRDGFISSGAAVDSTVIGRGASAPLGGTDSVVIGRGAASGAAAVDGIAIGRGASATGAPAIAIGAAANANANNTIAIGSSTVITNASSAIVIGHSSSATANGGSPNLLAIGVSAAAGRSVGGCISMAIGNSAVAREDDLVIGHQASSNVNAQNGNTVIGNNATINVSGAFGVAIGRLAIISAGAGSVIVGSSSSASAAENIIIGRGQSSSTANVGYFGAPNTDIRIFVIGAGNTSAAPTARTVRFTNGLGTNIAAGSITFQAPLSTGNAASANLSFTVGVVGASGATSQTTRESFRISTTVVAGETGISIYDVNTALLQRVLVGAAGTGPAGVGRALYLA
jgi:hypothetical protein